MIINESTQQNLVQAIDFIGQLFGLTRYTGESLEAFYKRCAQVYEYEGNTSLGGLRIAIARELGCPVRTCGVLGLKDREAYPNAGIAINNGYIAVYGDVTDIEPGNSEFLTTKAPDKESNFNYIKEFRDYIDSSDYLAWEVPVLDSELGTPMTNLLEGRSFRYYEDQEFIIEGMNRLKHRNILENSLIGSSYLANKVASPDLIENKGDYYFSRSSGSLITWMDPTSKVPKEIGSVSYIRTDPFFELKVVPVTIDELSDQFLNRQGYIDLKAADNINLLPLNIDKNLMKFVYKAFEADSKFWLLEDLNNSPMDINKTYRIGDAITDSIDHYYVPSGTLLSIIRELD
jgi:hypothetical protein